MESIQKTDRYKVLLIEDNPMDSKLIQEQLKYAKTANFKLQDTDKASKGLELLADEQFDVVLLDLSLPDARELEALDRIIDYNKDLPIVILTGMRDEELAISALRKGAQDYIIKGQFDVNLLIRAIHYAVERKKVEVKLRQSEEKYRILFETTKEGIIISKPDGTIIDVNPAAATSLGYRSTEDLKKTPINDIWMDLEQRKKVFRELNQREYVEDLETIGKKKDGNPVHVLASLKAHKDEEGNIRTIDGIFRDITERKKAEIALKQKTHDLSQRVKELNCLYGVSQLTKDPKRPLDEMLQQIIHLIPRAWQYPDIACARITYEGKDFLSSNFQETPWGQTADLVTSGEIIGGVAVYYLKEMPVLFEGPFLKEERELLNGLTREMGSYIERNQANLALQESESQYRQLVNSIQEIIFTLTPEGIITSLNPAFEEQTGWSCSDYINKPFFGILHPDEITPVLKIFESFSVGDKFTNYGIQIKTKSGKYLVYEGMITPKVESGKIVGYFGVAHDITERKKAEYELKNANTRLEYILATNPAVIFTCEPKGHYKTIFMSSSIKEITGYDAHDFIGQPDFWIKGLHPQDRQRVTTNFSRISETGYYGDVYRFRIRDGTYRWMLEEAKLVKDENGNPIEIVGYWTDITERKQVEKALQESEKKYRNLIDNLMDTVVELDSQGNFTFVSPQVFVLTGYKPEELIGKNSLEFIHPDDLKTVTNVFERVLEDEKVINFECRGQHKDGRFLWLSISSNLVEEDGDSNLVSIIRDITDRKQIENALKESEKRFRQLVETSPDGIVLTDLLGDIILINEQGTIILGYKDEFKLIGTNFSEVIAIESQELALRALKETLESGKGKQLEYTFIKKNGTRIPVEMNTTLIKDTTNSEQYFMSVIRDISERRQAEQASYESEKKYRYLIDNLMDTVVELDSQGNFTFVSSQVFELTGYKPEELIGKSSLSFVYPDDLETVTEVFERALEGKTEINYECRARHKDNQLVWISSSGRMVEKEDSFELVVILKNITDRKQAEEELRKNEEHFRQIFTRAPIGMVLADLNYGFLRSNMVFCHMLGYTEQELVKLTFQDVTHPDHVKRDIKQVKKLVKKEIGLYKTEERYIKKNKEIIWARTTVTLLLDEKDEPYCYLAMIEDISQQKQAEDEMKKQLMKFKIEDGNIYLVSESSPTLSKEVFNDLIKVGYSGLAISRVPEEEFKREFDVDFQFLWFSETENRNSLPPQLNEVEKTIDRMQAKSVIWIDRLDYLVLKNSFEETLKSVFRWREIAYLNDLVVVLSVDPTTLPKHHIQSLEKETKVVEPRFLVRVPDDILEILRFVHQQNNLGVKPSYTDIGNELEVSKPTIRKRLKNIVSTGHLNEQKSGNRKTLELTEKGQRLFTQ